MNVITTYGHRLTAASHTLLVLILLSTFSSASATTITLVNADGFNEGFNDNRAPFSGQTGNSGSTLGQQRLNVFKAAADYWEARIQSNVPIKVTINFDPLDCNSFGALLGSAGPNSVFRNFNGAPLSNTWYVEAVANSLAGVDGDATTNDISARFNSSVDNNNGCLTGTNWWLGINSPAPSNTIGLFDIVLHEIGHGLGVLSLVALTNIFDGNGNLLAPAGDPFLGFMDSYSYHLFDEQTQKFWRNMSDSQRVSSSINGPNLTWRGVNADNNSNHLNASVSRTNGNIRMYAPNPVETGSSVSHWDTSLSPNELMEPSATLTSDDRSTLQLLKDIGWELFEQSNESFITPIINYLLGEDPP